MKNINIRNATRSDIHQLVYLRKQYLIEKYGVKEIENDNMLFFQIQRYFNEHVDKDIDIVVAEADTNIIGVFCVSYLQLLEDKQSKYIHEYVKNKEYMIVGTERRHGFSQNDVDRQWHQIVDKIRKKQVDGVIVTNMSVITDNLIDAFVKIAQVQAAGGIIVTVDDGRLAMQLRGF